MKNHHFAVAAALLLGAAGLASCDKDNPLSPNKNNPTAVKLQASDFSVTLLDHENGYEKDSVYCFEGVWKEDAFYFGYWKLDPMTPNILPDGRNQLEFKIQSDATGFEGVNASSSSRCINIVQDGADHTRYHLEYVAEGESTITFWNGEGATRKEISFQATSKAYIPIETIKFRIDGELYQISHTACGYEEKFNLLKQFPAGAKWEDLPTFELVPTPLNATLKEGEIAYARLSIALYRVDENGNGSPLMTPDGKLVDNSIPWYLSYTYQDMKTFWPEFRWLSTQCHPSENYSGDDLLKVNFNDLRERHAKVYTTKMDSPFKKGYNDRIEFRWSIENEITHTMTRDRDQIIVRK